MAALGPCNPAKKIVIEPKIVIETCVRRTGSNVYNALMRTLGALTCTHKYLLRPETPWENDIGLINRPNNGNASQTKDVIPVHGAPQF